jgi:hypothetical protein
VIRCANNFRISRSERRPSDPSCRGSASESRYAGTIEAPRSSGTNPEVVLILEATRHNADERWSFGCVRLGHAEMEVKFDDRQVWRVPLYDQDNPKSPYYWIAKP